MLFRSYDPVNDFTPISLIAHFQFGVVSGPATQVKTVPDMMAKAKSDPATATYGSPGLGTLPHFMGVLMEQSSGIALNHIPFQGGGPANTALLGGHIGYKFDVVSETAELHRAGKVRIIAVTGPKRDPQVPEVPTLKESGIPMEATAWFAMYGPAHMPPQVLAHLEKAMTQALREAHIYPDGYGYKLRDASGQAVTLSALVEGQVMVMDLVQGHTAVEFGIRPGTRMTFHASDRKSTRLNSSHIPLSRMPSSA